MVRRRRALAAATLALLALVAVAAAFHRPLLRSAGAFLVVEDPLEPVDAIVVLAGGTPFREMSAATLYQRGLAGRVVISRAHTPDHVRALIDMGVRAHDYPGETRLVLERRGVPPDRIETVPDVSRITETELRAVGRYAARHGFRRVILVSSPEHTRRVRLVWSREAPAEIRALLAPAADDPFPLDDWWRRRRVAEAVLHEYLGLFAITFGLSGYFN